MADEEGLFQTSLEKAEKMTEGELVEHLRQYESVPLPYRVYQFELVRRGGQKMDKLARNVRLCSGIVLVTNFVFIILIWLLAKKLIP